MTESEKQEIRAKLIELSFREASEGGDPTAEIGVAGALLRRIESRIAV